MGSKKTPPQPGDIGLTDSHGYVGKLIKLAQWLNGEGWVPVTHAVVCVDVNKAGEPVVVQAEPGGANLRRFRLDDKVLWGHLKLTSAERRRIVRAARGYVGTPYSALDYFALLFHRLHLPLPFLKRYIRSRRHMICSQLADQAYRDAGVQLFNDRRWAGMVTPASLYHRLFTTPERRNA